MRTFWALFRFRIRVVQYRVLWVGREGRVGVMEHAAREPVQEGFGDALKGRILHFFELFKNETRPKIRQLYEQLKL